MNNNVQNIFKKLLPPGRSGGGFGGFLLMDGAMGSLIQEYGLTEGDFRGDMFRDWKVQLKGNNDILALTRPDVIEEIHRRYIEAGSDIIITDTFSAQRVSQQEYMLEDYVEQINRAAVRVAKNAVAKSGREVMILGDVGPTSRMLSMSDDVNDPAARSITFDELEAAYMEQMRVLIDEGVDGIILETCFDTLNVKAAISAFEKVAPSDSPRGEGTPLLFISMTISDASGRTLSGQTIEAFVASVAHANPTVIGMNCGLGAEAMVPYLRRMKTAIQQLAVNSEQLTVNSEQLTVNSEQLTVNNGNHHHPTPNTQHPSPITHHPTPLISCHPNAGLPNQFGEYDDTPEDMVRQIRPMIDEGLVDIIGGCCGTTPEHIRKLSPPAPKGGVLKDSIADHNGYAGGDEKGWKLSITGLEAYHYSKDDFVVVGERCNVAGSRKFLRLINEKKYDEALDIARTQVEKGAMVIDVNMDDGLLDAKQEMTTFLNLLMSDPSICRVPIMVDSSRFDVIEAGLKCCQGKCVVNSLSLKQGEEQFLEHARVCKRLGAAVIVMLFDEEGQANDYQRRITIAERAYRLLVDKVGYQPNDIIFDPNVLTIATGMEEHRNYARDFIRATEWITQHLPGARISGGLSNLSFAFRGNNYLRECMHSVFLHHATAVGMNMAIMNPATAVKYDSIDGNLRDVISRVILNSDDNAEEELMALAQQLLEKLQAEKAAKAARGNAAPVTAVPSVHEEDTPEHRLQTALLKGVATNLDADIHALLDKGETPLSIISGPLMQGMNAVGKLFGEGKMFLPQVVKTARTMKKAVEILEPYMDNQSTHQLPQGGENENIPKDKSNLNISSPRGGRDGASVLLATVKGDVHDIGKNIVGVVLACNGFNVIDLGVMVPVEKIIDEAQNNNVDIICLSGLITPSLDEMCRVAEAMQDAAMTIPLFIGGATTSEIHTAVKVAPLYQGGVFHMRDASQNPVVAMQLLDAEQHDEVMLRNRSRQQRIRLAQHKKELRLNVQRATSDALGELTPLQRRFACNWDEYTPVQPPFVGQGTERRLALRDIIPCIDWLYFYWAWRVKEDSDEGRLLRHDAEKRLAQMAATDKYDVRTLQAFYPARGESDNIHLGITKISTPRQPLIMANGKRREQCLALCDYVSPNDNDYIGVFAATMSETFVAELEAFKQSGADDYEMLLLQTIGDRLAEAASEYLSNEMAQGYDVKGQHYSWQGIRPAVGYPSLPDQKTIFSLAKLIDYPAIGISLTENGAMYPQASVTGLYISHPDSNYFAL